jgi:hypothetical protein
MAGSSIDIAGAACQTSVDGWRRYQIRMRRLEPEELELTRQANLLLSEKGFNSMGLPAGKPGRPQSGLIEPDEISVIVARLSPPPKHTPAQYLHAVSTKGPAVNGTREIRLDFARVAHDCIRVHGVNVVAFVKAYKLKNRTSVYRMVNRHREMLETEST